MSRYHRGFHGEGTLVLSSGDVFSGKYRITVSYYPVRNIYQAEGQFQLDTEAPYASVVDAGFGGSARIIMSDGQEIQVVLGGIESLSIPLRSTDAKLLPIAAQA